MAVVPETQSATLDEIQTALGNLDSIIARLEGTTAFMGTKWGNLTVDQRQVIDDVVADVAAATQVEKSAVMVFINDKAEGLASCGGVPDTNELDNVFCLYTVMSDSDFVVSNAKRNQYVKNMSHVRNGDIVAYLGTPVYSQGKVAGSLCVYQETVRKWTTDDLDAAHDGARRVGEVLDQ